MLRPYNSPLPPRSERACHPERRRREGPAFRERRAPAGPSRPFPLMRDASASRSFARARPARSLRMTTPPRSEREKREENGGPSFPLSTSWRGGQGVRTTRGATDDSILTSPANGSRRQDDWSPRQLRIEHVGIEVCPVRPHDRADFGVNPHLGEGGGILQRSEHSLKSQVQAVATEGPPLDDVLQHDFTPAAEWA